MIYFKISSIIEDSDNKDLHSIISTAKTSLIVKIGYTDDNPDIARNRDFSYRTENPSIIHYKYILGGTRDDESLIHQHLKDYLYSGREWFRLTPEVIDFIEKVNTIGDIRELLNITPSKILLSKMNYKYVGNRYKDKSQVLKFLVPAILETIYPNINTTMNFQVYEET